MVRIWFSKSYKNSGIFRDIKPSFRAASNILLQSEKLLDA